MKQNIFLVGPMGAGKTSVGRQLAKALNMEFVDSDREIEKRTGVSIPTIFDIEGEQGFRDRETHMIAELVKCGNIVLATGGGVVMQEENRENLTRHGYVIYLHAPVKLLYQRTKKDRNRPLLQTEDPLAKLQELMEIRDPLYRQVANLVVETDRQSIRQVVKDILTRMEKVL